jgi:hypothetical protein
VSTEQLKTKAMALPLKKRVSLAQALWEIINAGLAEEDEASAIAEALERNDELSSGAVKARSHEEVMETVLDPRTHWCRD